ncbi:hypothetical protein [Burkholderia ubonensis]|nr:hypothetical protein [Burkholderia ubonensis]
MVDTYLLDCNACGRCCNSAPTHPASRLGSPIDPISTSTRLTIVEVVVP